MFSDLFLNIIAEIIGIVITVFWIDRLIKKREKEREEKRWLPSKNYVLYHFAYSLSTLIQLLKPDEDRDSDTKFIYFYGDKVVHSEIDFLKEASQSAEGYVSRIIHSFDDRKNEIVIKRGENAEKFLDLYGQLLEPELLYLLMEYRYQIPTINLEYQRKGDKSSRREKTYLESSLIYMVESIFPILVWLDKHATKKMTYEEYRAKNPIR